MIYARFKKTLLRYGMLAGGEKVLAAVSGGVDSMVLLHLLARYAGDFGGEIAALHMNHGLRGDESDRDEFFARDAALKMGIPFISERVDIGKMAAEEGINVQEAGRRERYAFFERALGKMKGDRVALGHNSDDQAETVLMRMIRGAGIRGIGGIPPVRGRIIRPLIEVSRKEIEEYATREDIRHVEDSSNLSGKYLRNRVRRELLPLLKSYNPNISLELNRLADVARKVEEHLEDEARAAVERAGRYAPCDRRETRLDRALISGLPEAIFGRAIFMALEEASGKRSGFFSAHIRDISSLILEGKSGSSLNLPGGIRASIEYGAFVLSGGGGAEIGNFSYPLETGGDTAVKEAGIILTSERIGRGRPEKTDGVNSAIFDIDKISLPLLVRSFRPGDRIRLEGMEGRKKLKDFFIDEKIPRRERKRTPLLVSGDEVLWIVGRRQGSAAAATDKTGEALLVTARETGK